MRKPGIIVERAYGAMRVFSNSGQNYQSPVFVIFMPKNLSTNLPPPTEGKGKLPRWNKPSFRPTYSVQLPYAEPVAKGDN